MIEYVSDAVLGLYGRFATPHRGRDRMVAMLSDRARGRWNGVRTMNRRGLRIESDFSVDDVGWMLYSYGCLDYFDESAIHKMLPAQGVCLDIGAHIGYYSLLMSKWVGPQGRVVSFEPVPYTHSFLQRNLARNNASNVLVQHAAVGDQTGSVRMAAGHGQRLGWSSVSDAGELEVRCTTVDAEVERLNLSRVDFIKMDVEGYELRALTGAAKTLQRFRPNIMFEVNYRALEQHSTTPAMLQAFFESRRYALFRTDRDALTAVHDLTSGPSFFNVFALPQPKATHEPTPRCGRRASCATGILPVFEHG